MTTHNQTSPPGAPDAYDPPSTAERLEEDAALAGVVAAEGLRVFEVGLIVLIGLLVCPPLAILTFLVVGPLFVAALAFGLFVFIVSIPYLLMHHFRADHGDHVSLLRQRIRHVARAIVDLAPHRIVADVRNLHPHR